MILQFMFTSLHLSFYQLRKFNFRSHHTIHHKSPNHKILTKRKDCSDIKRVYVQELRVSAQLCSPSRSRF